MVADASGEPHNSRVTTNSAAGIFSHLIAPKVRRLSTPFSNVNLFEPWHVAITSLKSELRLGYNKKFLSGQAILIESPLATLRK